MKLPIGCAAFIALAFGQCAIAGGPTTLADLYKEYLEVGVVGGEHRASREPETALQLSAARDNVLYLAPSSVAFSFPVPFTSKSAAVAIMEVVAADLRRVCDSSGGQVKFTAGGVKGEPVVEREVKSLQAKGLFGRFECLSESAPFEVEVQPGEVVRKALATPSWSLVLATATSEKILKVRDEIRKDAEEADEFRRAIKPGTHVAVIATEVPSHHLTADQQKLQGMLRGKKYYLCGLAIDVKESLVQVQVNGGLFFTAPSNLRPVMRRVEPRGSVPLDRWGRWCLTN